MSILSNILKNKFKLPEVNITNLPLAKLFLNELQLKGSRWMLESLSNADILMIVKILKTEVEIRESSKDFSNYKKAGIGVNYDSNSNIDGNTNK
jgi:hypothetical protein